MENKAASFLLRRMSAMRDDMTELRNRASYLVNTMEPSYERNRLRDYLVLLDERDKVTWEKLIQHCAETDGDDTQTKGKV